jgi:hypothetical protein
MEVHKSRLYWSIAMLWLVLPAVSFAVDVVHFNLSTLSDEAACVRSGIAAGDNT